ncbi:MAG: glycosyltransferase family 39 protein [Candidatus Omnitrophota bacterium]
MAGKKIRHLAKRCFFSLSILGVFTYLLKFSWLKWGNLVIDTGRELYVPLRILKGSVLYRDIWYDYGPFSPYFNSLLCAIFGLHMRSFIISGALTTVVTSFLLYKISRVFLNALLSLAPVLTFLFVFAFGQLYEAGIFNYILPYSYPAIHSMAFALGALFFYYKALKKKKGLYVYLSGLLVSLTLLTRIEIGIMLVVSLLSGVILEQRSGPFKERYWRLRAHCIYPLFSAILVYGLFAAAYTKIAGYGSAANYMEIFFKNLDTKAPFTGALMGITGFRDNMLNIAVSGIYYLAIIAMFFGAGLVTSVIRKKYTTKVSIIASVVLLTAAAAAVFFQQMYFPYYLQYKCVPIICVILFVVARNSYLKGLEPERYLFLMVFSMFSCFTLARMFFNVWAGHYGFYLLVPGMVCYYIFFLNALPNAFRRKEAVNAYRLVFVIFSLSFIISHFSVSSYAYKSRSMKITLARGAMRVRPAYHRYAEMMDYLKDNTARSDSLVAFPEGVMLNFLSGIDNPLRFYTFLPIDFARHGFEKDVIEGLEKNKVRYVVILNRNTLEYGPARFGIDYARGLMQDILRHYMIKRQFGPLPFTTNEVTMVLMERVE